MSSNKVSPKNKWLGAKKAPNQVENENQHANFFTNTDVLTGQSILIRESIQNAIDARDKANGCTMAHVRFYVGTVDAAIGKKYFVDQYARIMQCLKNIPQLENECHYIAVEDFNTTGLVGSLNNDLPEGDSRIGSFFFFTWATGKSNKSIGTRGKNGVGKIVFPKTSKIKSFLVFSSREVSDELNEPKNILFGTSILRTHEFEGVKWLPESHWMTENESGLHVPSSNLESISDFAQDWKLKRKIDQKGTSIVIPYRDENFSGKNLAQCVAQDYFIAILEGILEVEVVDEAGFQVQLNASNLMENLEALDENLVTKSSKSKSELLALCELFEERQSKETNVVSTAGKTAGRNYWEEHEFAEETRDLLRDELDMGKTLEFRVSTFVPAIADGTPVAEDFFSVLVRKKDGAHLPPTFARQGIIIPSAYINRIEGYTTLVIIEDGRLADLLGDAEGPSHEKWSSEEEKFQGKYLPKIASEETIKFVRNSVISLLRKIQVQANEVEDSRFANAFPYPTDDGARPIDGEDSVGPSTPRKTPPKKRIKRIPIKRALVSENFVVNPDTDGFTVEPSSSSKLLIGDKFKIKSGYDLSAGNPLAKSSVDFEIAHRLKLANGVTLITASDNYITFVISKMPFRCSFDGFHTYRDLIVAVNDVN